MGLWLGITTAVGLLLNSGRAADTIPYPGNWLEGILAVCVAASAGVCEEIVFRGYFYRQFYALTRSVAAAVLLQAIVFGAPHVYQGVRPSVMAAA